MGRTKKPVTTRWTLTEYVDAEHPMRLDVLHNPKDEWESVVVSAPFLCKVSLQVETVVTTE